MTLSLACPDWEERIAARRSLVPAGALGLNPGETSRARAIFDLLRLPDVPGTPMLAEAAGEWFRELVGVFLGAVDPASGNRLIRELFLLAPKKSSKTSYGSALMLTALLMNKRPRAEFLLIAPTQAVAELAFSQAVGMIELDPELRYREAEDKSASGMHVQQHMRCITRWHEGEHRGQLKIKSFDSGVLTGVRPAGVLVDELHEIAKNAQAASIVGQIRGGLLPIPEAFLAVITTQSDRQPAGVFRAELLMARGIRDRERTGSMLPILYEFPRPIARDPDLWRNPENWPLVTPNLDRSVTLPRLVEDFETAEQKGPDEVIRWASQHLNIEVGVGQHSDRWAGAEYWAGAADKTLTLDSLIQRCEVAVVGIDGGGLDDLLGLAVLGREKGTGRWLLWNRAWAHPIVLQRRKSEAAKLRDLSANGELVIVERLGDDIAGIVSIVQQLQGAGLLPEKNAVGLDPVGVKQIVEALRELGLEENVQITGVSQGWKLQGAIKTLERKLAEGGLLHAGQDLMAWCVGNAKVELKGNAITITKQAAGTAKIDPLMASFDASHLMPMVAAPAVSFWERAAA